MLSQQGKLSAPIVAATAAALTDDERKAMHLTADLVNLVIGHVIGHGPTRGQDISEFVRDVHAIQHRIMAQAAARAYPDLYRLLGEVVD